MKSVLALIKSIAVLGLFNLAAYAGDPDSQNCTVSKQVLAKSEYNIIVVDDMSGDLVPFLRRSIEEVKDSYPNEIGGSSFNVYAMAPQEEVVETAAYSGADYYVCAYRFYDFCDQFSPSSAVLRAEWSKMPSSERAKENAAGHIARASISMIQLVEAGSDQDIDVVPAVLSEGHLLSKQGD